MDRTAKRWLQACAKPQQGLAISMILLAVVLLFAIAAVISFGTQASVHSSQSHDGLMAGTILSQGAMLKGGLAQKTMQVGIGNADLSTGDPYGVFNANNGTLEPQIPPPEVFANTSNTNWFYYYCCNGHGIQFMGIGDSPALDSFLALGGLTKGICQQIDQQVNGSTTIPAPATGTWAQWQAGGLDLSSDNAVNGKYSQCVQTTDGVYVYYLVTQADG